MKNVASQRLIAYTCKFLTPKGLDIIPIFKIILLYLFFYRFWRRIHFNTFYYCLE